MTLVTVMFVTVFVTVMFVTVMVPVIVTRDG